tara:strand:+ start:1567 stop:2037 length:471 start_codon:yes stop_codon:yes gene_type:complete
MNWKLFSIGSAIIFSIASLLLRYYEKLNKKITAFQLLFGVSVFMFILIMILYIFDKRKRLEVNEIIYNKQFLLWIGLYAILFIIGDYLYYSGHINTPHIALLFIVLTGGIAIEIIGSHYLFGEKLQNRSILGGILVISGVILLENSNGNKKVVIKG